MFLHATENSPAFHYSDVTGAKYGTHGRVAMKYEHVWYFTLFLRHPLSVTLTEKAFYGFLLHVGLNKNEKYKSVNRVAYEFNITIKFIVIFATIKD